MDNGKKERLISIIVPVYNIHSYIERCVSSICVQNDVDLEIILVDDGSTDGSGAICDQLALKDNRICVYHKENGGLSDARNYGMERATGKYILFLDGDDYLNGEMLVKVFGDVIEKKADVIIGKVQFLVNSSIMDQWDEAVEKNFELHRVYTGKEYLLKCLQTSDIRVEIGRHLYKREFLKKFNFRFQKGILHEDEEFTPRVLLTASRVILINDLIYYYDNRRPGSITNAPELSERRIRDRLKIYDYLSEVYQSVTPRELRRRLEDNICWKYLDCQARFDCSTLPNYQPQRLRMLRFAYRPKRRLKACLFAISPKLFHTMMGRYLKRSN